MSFCFKLVPYMLKYTDKRKLVNDFVSHPHSQMVPFLSWYIILEPDFTNEATHLILPPEIFIN